MAEIKNAGSQTTKEITPELLKKALVQQKQRADVLEQKLNSINSTLVRLNLLFEVIKQADLFGEEFTSDCVEEIKAILTIKYEKNTEASVSESTETAEKA